MKLLLTRAAALPSSPQLASRRNWLKGVGALFGSGLLAAAPTALLASPAPAPEAASPLVGGTEYIGIVKLLAGATVPQGWALCDGRVLPVHEHPALFALLGNTYGGDGRRTFALPNLSEAMAGSPEKGVLPTMHCAIKIANAPAAAEVLAELHLHHHRKAGLRLA